MLETACIILTVLGLALLCFLTWCQRALLTRPAPPRVHPAPPVSILRPLKGLDPGFEADYGR